MLLDRLASGGMGEVFRARQMGTGGFQKTVAVKRILPQFANRPDFGEMFQQEMNLCAKLQHQNIVQVFANGREGGYLYLVMEFVNGRSVSEMLIEAKRRKLRIPPEVSCFIVAEAAQGLAYAHSLRDETSGMPLNIVHRDVSPQNIMLGYAGEIKLVDFGIAKAADRSERKKTGDLKGKVPYAAPEYINGHEPDSRADIFGLGVVFHELLAQRPLFSADSTYETIQNVLEMPIPSLVEQFPDVRFELESIVMRALERDPLERYQDAAEMSRAISIFMNKAYPNFTRSEFTRYIATLYSVGDNPSVARLRDLYGYAKEVPARLVEAATNSLALPANGGRQFLTRLAQIITSRRVPLAAILAGLIGVLALILLLIAPRHHVPEIKPSEVGNILAWYAPENAGAPSSRLESWKDGSWLDSPAAQPDQPLQPEILGNALKDLPVVHFDGTSTFLIANGVAASLARAKGLSVFYVARLIAKQGVPQYVWAAQAADKNLSVLRGGFAFGNRVRLQLASKDPTLFDDSSPLPVDTFAVYSTVVNSERATVLRNGREVVLARVHEPLPYESITHFSIGQAYQGGKEAGFFSGDLAEIIIYSRAVTIPERKQIERYLSRKYGLALEE